MTGLAVLSFAGALALPMLGLVGGAFFPDSDDSEFLINIETPPGSNLAYTKLKSEEAARLARALPDVSYTYTTIGGRTGSVDEAIVYVKLPPEVHAQPAAAGDRSRSSDQARAARRRLGQHRQRELREPEADPAPAAGTGQPRAESTRAARARPRSRRCPAPWTSASRRADRSRRSKSRWIAGSREASASRSGRWRRRCASPFAGLDSGDWIDPSGETRDVYVRLKPEARTQRAGSRVAAALRPGRRRARRGRAARSGGAHLERSRARAHRPPRSRACHLDSGEYASPARSTRCSATSAPGSTRA